MNAVRETLATAVEQLRSEPIGPPRMAAEALLMHVLGCDRAHLHAHPERQLTPAELARFTAAVARRAAGEPLQYITGHQEFWGLDFQVTPAVLIPRPETEHLVSAALARCATRDHVRIVDVGTGSGCVILALAAEKPEAELHATDISAEALAVASQNAGRLGFGDRVAFHQGDLLAPFAGAPGSFALVVSNPPYVGRNEADKVQREVREHEPAVAVFAGREGLDVYRRLIPQAWTALRPGGGLLLEIGYSIESPVRALLTGWIEVTTVPDLQGIPRVITARKPL